MNKEQKIREAYEKAVALNPYVTSYYAFEAGYIALLNSLEFVSVDLVIGATALYRLPEGVER